MSGFPSRPTRTTFGPPLVNVRPVSQPDKELDAGIVDLAWWQMAGASRTTALAVVIYNGTTQARVFQGLAWDASNKQAPIPAVKVGTGQYTFTFASSYPDEKGQQISFTPRAAIAFVQGAAAQIQAVCTINGQAVSVEVANQANTHVDATFMMMVW